MSKSIKILGTGCPSCLSAEKIVEEVVNELKIDAKIEKVTDIMEIMVYDVMTTPAIVVDGKVMIKGKVPSVDEVKAILVDNYTNNACCSDDASSSCC
jgi:small redox-active disulfide protein 2